MRKFLKGEGSKGLTPPDICLESWIERKWVREGGGGEKGGGIVTLPPRDQLVSAPNPFKIDCREDQERAHIS